MRRKPGEEPKKLGRRPDPRRYEYAKKYEVTLRQVLRIGVDELDRMAEHARATMFSTEKWEKANPEWRKQLRPICEIFEHKSKPVRSLDMGFDRRDKIRHGTNAGYSIDLCRCIDCREAHRQYMSAWRQNKSNPAPKVDKVDRMMELVDSLYKKRAA